jgi:hypothetical protein
MQTNIERNKNINAFQEYLSARISFPQGCYLTDNLNNKNDFIDRKNNFKCVLFNNKLDIRANAEMIAYICQYFNFEFEYVHKTVLSIIHILDEYGLTSYTEFQKNTLQFSSNIYTLFRFKSINEFDLQANHKNSQHSILFRLCIDFSSEPKVHVYINIPFYSSRMVGLEISKSIHSDVVVRVSRLKSLSTVSRSRKDYKIVDEKQLMRHVKRYAFRRLRAILRKLLKIEDDQIFYDPDQLRSYIALAEMVST